MKTSIAILMPVYDDWASLEQVILQIDAQAAAIQQPIAILVVNDGSLADPPPLALGKLKYVRSIRCAHLVTNQGHQRAIAIGLVMLSGEGIDAVIVMDADGEDSPQDLPRLLEQHRSFPDHIVVARRAARSEGPAFRAFYTVYKVLFWLLTGSDIRFGNFCLIPSKQVANLVYRPDLWNHLAATIRRSKLPFLELASRRAKRIAGQSRMNFTALVLHGLSGISVYLDMVAVRILMFALTLAGLATLGILATLIVRYFTPLAIPGWATTVVGLLTLIILQTILFSAAVLFGILNARSRRQIIPALDAALFIRSEEQWYPGSRS